MKYILIFALSLLCCFPSYAQLLQDNFEGNGNISTWTGDDCGIDSNFSNPFQQGENTSSKVLKYEDTGGTFANIRFEVNESFDLSKHSSFSLKVFVPSDGLTGSQPNQVSLKLQDGSLPQPWSTQSEIIKPLILDQWQEVSFNFSTDAYRNLDAGSPPPATRTDFNRLVIQINGENNADKVTAYLDDFFFDSSLGNPNSSDFNQLVWSDEFDGSGQIDTSKWFQQTQLPNGNSWYNNEVQHYTDRIENSFLDSGYLHIMAKKETFTDQGQTKQYTSARLNSKFAFTYGRIEVRAKLPFGLGTWPAIWTLGKNINEPGAYWEKQHGTVSWPACGEIDIMEHWGYNPNFVQSAIHTPSSFGATVNLGGRFANDVSNTFHVYAAEWTSEKIVFSVDGIVHYTYHPAIKDDATWPFDVDQYLLLNVAMQGNIAPDFSQSPMIIDYVRVYQQGPTSVAKPVAFLDLDIFPNPVTDELNILLATPLPQAKLNVYSPLGQLVHEQDIKGKAVKMDWSSYPSGIYKLVVRAKEGERTYKILKK